MPRIRSRTVKRRVPLPVPSPETEITLRDLFAAFALCGRLMSNEPVALAHTVRDAWSAADEMLMQRELSKS